jgi:streptogramin lyase
MPNDDVVARIERGHSLDPAFHAAGRRPERLTYARGRLYVASRYDDKLVVLDPRTLHPAQPPLPMPLNPFAVTSDGRHVWVAGLGENTVTLVDLS